MARLMNTAPRTLKRRLQEEGTTFRALLAQARGAMAETLLGDARLSLAEVAERLGFSDLSSFSQAFAGAACRRARIAARAQRDGSRS